MSYNTIEQDFHMHTTFSDGNATPEEMVKSAIKKGLKRVGISDHSFQSFDMEGTLLLKKYKEYIDEISRLKEAYKDQIEVFCGLEQDMFSPPPAEIPNAEEVCVASPDKGRCLRQQTVGFDYIIGSAHYVKVEGSPNPAYAGNQNGFNYDGSYLCIDASAEIFEQGCKKYFAGDYLALAESYFDTVSRVVEATDCDIIGHFDLVGKFNYKGKYFDEDDPRYISAWQKAADILLKCGYPFEINTRPYYLGLRPYPYPAPHIIAYLKERGARFVLSSDSHSPDTIAEGFSWNA